MTPHKQRLQVVQELRETEKARRATLTKETLKEEPSILDVLLSQISNLPSDLGTLEEWRSAIHEGVKGRKPRKHEGAPYTAPRLRFYPTTQTPEFFKERNVKYAQLWNAAALALRPEADRIREEYAAAFKTLNTRFESEGKLTIDDKKKKMFVNGTKEEYEKEVKLVHKAINKMGRMNKASKLPMDFMSAAIAKDAQRKIVIEKNGWDASAVAWLNYVIAYYPSDVIRQVREVFSPQAQIKDLSNPDFRFVGRAENVGGGGKPPVIFVDAPAQKKSVLKISEAYNPTDHHGRRAGKTLEQAQLRLVTVTALKSDGQSMYGNVLFNSQAIGRNGEKRLIKGYKLHSDKDAWGREQFWFIPTLEHIEAPRNLATGNKIAGCDIGWRTNETGIEVMHIRTENEYLIYHLEIKDNLWIRKHNKKYPEFEIHLNDLENFQSCWDTKMDEFKALIETVLSPLPPNWGHYRAPQLISLFGIKHGTKELRHPELASLKAEFEIWNANNTRRQQIHNHVVTQHKADLKCQYRAMFFDLVKRGVGKIVLEDLGLKEMAESENKGENWRRHISNVSRGNRHKASLSNLILIFKQLGYKYGVEVVSVNPRETTRRCNSCGHVNDKEKTVSFNKKFECEMCGVLVIRDENSCLNIRDMYIQGVGTAKELKVIDHLESLSPTLVRREEFLPTPPPVAKLKAHGVMIGV